MSCLCNFILIFCLLSEWCMQWFRSHDSSRCKQCCLCTSVSLQDPDLQLDERVSKAAAVLPLTAKRELMTTHVKLTASAQRSDLTVTHSAALHHVNQTPDRETERYMLRSNDPGSIYINAWQWVCCVSHVLLLVKLMLCRYVRTQSGILFPAFADHSGSAVKAGLWKDRPHVFQRGFKQRCIFTERLVGNSSLFQLWQICIK